LNLPRRSPPATPRAAPPRRESVLELPVEKRKGAEREGVPTIIISITVRRANIDTFILFNLRGFFLRDKALSVVWLR
jgi:hypothetical protein